MTAADAPAQHAAAPRLLAAMLAAVVGVALTIASVPLPFGPLAVAVILLAVRASLRRSIAPLAEAVGQALMIVAVLAALVGLALATSYSLDGGHAAPRTPPTTTDGLQRR